MEESRIDPYQIVGFLLLIACAFYVFNMSPQPVENINENNSETNDYLFLLHLYIHSVEFHIDMPLSALPKVKSELSSN